MAGAGHPFRVSGPAAASLLVNGLLVAALLNLGMGHAGRRAESPALTVLSLALPKGAEQGKEEAEADAPSVAATPPASPADPPPAQPPAAAAVAPAAVMIPSRLALPMPAALAGAAVSTAAAPAQPVSAAAAAPSPPAAPAARRGAADGLDAKAPSGTSRSYAAKVRSWLYAHKIYPRRARMRREEGRVQVRFVIDRAGMLLEGAVIRGSGVAALDEEAEAMMRRASPYPRAPNELPGERIEFTVPIEFILPV
ncbi:TonB family protein [Sphingomonas paucimobilis]|nr:TonB family protein [Sphingomonas paucimobilis]